MAEVILTIKKETIDRIKDTGHQDVPLDTMVNEWLDDIEAKKPDCLDMKKEESISLEQIREWRKRK